MIIHTRVNFMGMQATVRAGELPTEVLSRIGRVCGHVNTVRVCATCERVLLLQIQAPTATALFPLPLVDAEEDAWSRLHMYWMSITRYLAGSTGMLYPAQESIPDLIDLFSQLSVEESQCFENWLYIALTGLTVVEGGE